MRTDPPPSTTSARLAATSHDTTRALAGRSMVRAMVRYGGIRRTTPSTSIDGAKTAAPLTVRRTSRSSWQLSHVATCASTRFLASPASVRCNRSGSISWILLSVHLVIFQKLLYRLERVVVVDPCRTLGASHYVRDLLV